MFLWGAVHDDGANVPSTPSPNTMPLHYFAFHSTIKNIAPTQFWISHFSSSIFSRWNFPVPRVATLKSKGGSHSCHISALLCVAPGNVYTVVDNAKMPTLFYIGSGSELNSDCKCKQPEIWVTYHWWVIKHHTCPVPKICPAPISNHHDTPFRA